MKIQVKMWFLDKDKLCLTKRQMTNSRHTLICSMLSQTLEIRSAKSIWKNNSYKAAWWTPMLLLSTMLTVNVTFTRNTARSNQVSQHFFLFEYFFYRKLTTETNTRLVYTIVLFNDTSNFKERKFTVIRQRNG